MRKDQTANKTTNQMETYSIHTFPKKTNGVNHNGYKGYCRYFKGVSYIVWNGSSTNVADWYIDVIDSPNFNFSERDLSRNYSTKKAACLYFESLINETAK